jgi:hypothetical protein
MAAPSAAAAAAAAAAVAAAVMHQNTLDQAEPTSRDQGGPPSLVVGWGSSDETSGWTARCCAQGSSVQPQPFAAWVHTVRLRWSKFDFMRSFDSEPTLHQGRRFLFRPFFPE